MTKQIIRGFLIANWYWIALGIGILVLFFVLVSGSCRNERKVEINEEAIQKVNSADRREREAALEKVITENRDAIESVDNRNISIQQEIKRAEAAIEASKRQGKDVSAEELEVLLLGNKQ